jgi:deazaflavin-dependent oxidoreductase (nitroreductase family)
MFDEAIVAAAARQQEVDLTTFGRRTGRASRRTIWVTPVGRRLYIRSGGGLARDWPRNLLANGRGILHLAGRDLPVRARHLTDPAEARATAAAVGRKYASARPASADSGSLTPAEQATFELLPDTSGASGQ